MIFIGAYVLTLYNMNYSGGTQNGTRNDIQSTIIEMVRLNPKVTRKAMVGRNVYEQE